jgi:hypothetical protein
LRRRLLLFLTFALLLPTLVPATASAKPRSARRASLRTGLLIARDEDLVRAVKKKDRATIERLAARMGPSRVALALRRPEPAVVQAALVAAPLVRGAPLLIGSVSELLESPDAAVATAAAGVLGQLMDGRLPSALDDLEVPADQVVRACGALRTLASRVEAPVPSRLAALGATASAATVCTATGELGSLLRDPVAAVRRATALILRPEERRASSALREVIHDPDPAVASAAVAVLCRAEGRRNDGGVGAGVAITAAAGRPDPVAQQTVEAARALVASPTTPAEDAVEMLSCLARAGTPSDRQILVQLRAGAPSPLRDRAAELAAPPDRLTPK